LYHCLHVTSPLRRRKSRGALSVLCIVTVAEAPTVRVPRRVDSRSVTYVTVYFLSASQRVMFYL